MNRVVATLCLAEALSLIGAFAFPALLPEFRDAWALSNADAGWIAGIFFLGYALAVPVLTALTDRLDAKRVFLFGTLVSAIGCGGFALLADGFWSAMLLRMVGGIGLAGVYMPGLKALIDRFKGGGQARAISFYTASFSLGTMLSFLIIGEVAQRLRWQAAFGLAAAAALISVLLAASLPPVTPEKRADSVHLLDFRPVLRNRRAMGYVLGYTCHMWELFVFRSWLVAFLVFVQAGQPQFAGPTTIATLSAMLAMLSSLLGADLAIRFDRRLVCSLAMAVSGGVGLVFGLTSDLGYGLAAAAALFYSFVIQLDSAALTTGAILEATPGRQGATTALHSLLGFGAAFVGPLVHGVVLDAAGGATSVWSWWLAFAVTAVVALLGPLALRNLMVIGK